MEAKVRKVLITNGMMGDKEIYLTDVPAEEIEYLLREKSDLWHSNGYVKFLASSDRFDEEDMKIIGWDEEYDIMNYAEKETHWYELRYFFSRTETGLWHVKTDANIDNMSETAFLDYLLYTGHITYDQGMHIYEVNEITEAEYKSFRYEWKRHLVRKGSYGIT